MRPVSSEGRGVDHRAVTPGDKGTLDQTFPEWFTPLLRVSWNNLPLRTRTELVFRSSCCTVVNLGGLYLSTPPTRDRTTFYVERTSFSYWGLKPLFQLYLKSFQSTLSNPIVCVSLPERDRDLSKFVDRKKIYTECKLLFIILFFFTIMLLCVPCLLSGFRKIDK